MDRSFRPPSGPAKNRNNLTAILLLFCIIFSVNGYTLDGQWQLTPETLSYTQQNPNVTFVFSNKIPQQVNLFMAQDALGGSTIGNARTGTTQLTVYACKTLKYNYYVNESSLYLQPVSTGSDNRECLKN